MKDFKKNARINRPERRRYTGSSKLPPVAVLQISHVGEDGYAYAQLATKSENKKTPPIVVVNQHGETNPALEPGARVLARISRDGSTYMARIVRRIATQAEQVVGVYRETSGKGKISSSNRRHKYDLSVSKNNNGGSKPNELVLAEVLPRTRGREREARVIERLGSRGQPYWESAVAILERNLPHEFAPEVKDFADRLRPATISDRVDLRHIPFVTIDGTDARDFDDAIWAVPDNNENNKSGWRLIVAIADVSNYVKFGDPIDNAARERGNSVYFPDRVIPMLPEKLSNDLCSLLPNEDRAAFAVEMIFDGNGNKLNHKFMRVLIRSHARLTYTEVQNAYDGIETKISPEFRRLVIEPLYEAWNVLQISKNTRQPLNISSSESQIYFNDNGLVTNIQRLEHFDSHKIIEDFMISANVCAAETLENASKQCIYRIHERPDTEKLRSLKLFLNSLGFNIALTEEVRPQTFNCVIDKAKSGPLFAAINQAILRTQSQAVYSPKNIGHFGLALTQYAHFTSPIRRYADLMVHRALINNLEFGIDNNSTDDPKVFEEISKHISNTERRAMAAERETKDRYLASHLQNKVGIEFSATINGITRAGLFVTLVTNGADGLIPMSKLPNEYYVFDDRHKTLTGEKTGTRFRIGDNVRTVIAETNPLTGSITLHLLQRNADIIADIRPKRRKKGSTKYKSTRSNGKKRRDNRDGVK